MPMSPQPATGRHDAKPPDDLPDDMDAVAFDLADLVADADGEVVLFNDSRLQALLMSADAALIDEGEVAAHRTASGDNVSGFRFYLFESGLRLYFPSDLELVLRRPQA